MALEIVTGYTGQPHITSQQDAILNAAAFASGEKYVIGVGNQFEYELESNNLIRINDGYAINQGRLMGMSNGDYETLEISTGLKDTKRSDLVVIRYSKDDSTGIESAELKVIEGIAGDDYVDPEYLDNDLLNANYTEDDIVLYRIKIDGLSVAEVEQLYKIWHLDTGWREDLVTVDHNPVSSNSAPAPAIRIIGNQVFFRDANTFVTSDDAINYTIPSEYAPPAAPIAETRSYRYTPVSTTDIKPWNYVVYGSNYNSGNIEVNKSGISTPFTPNLNLTWLLD